MPRAEDSMSYDLILRGGRVVDPSQKVDAVTDIAFSGGKVVRIGAGLRADAETDVRDVSGRIVTPGLIDLQHPRLLGRDLARHRRRGFLPPLGGDHRRRYR
jgi:predicted amidohydrolase YtcJ